MNKTYQSILILVTLIVLLIGYLSNSLLIIKEMLDYSLTFLIKIFPIYFIFITLSNLLINYKIIEVISKLFHINTARVYILILSFITGFPSGASYTKDLYLKGIITLDEANYFLKFSHFPNPLLIFSTISTVVGKYLSFKIYLAIILSNLILFIFKKYKKNNIYINNITFPKSFSSELNESTKKAFDITLSLYGSSIFFYLIVVIITHYFYLNNYFYVLISGIFTITKGIISVTRINNIIIRAFFILFFISFGGVSVNIQVKGILTDTNINYSSYLLGRIYSTVLSFLILFIIIYVT